MNAIGAVGMYLGGDGLCLGMPVTSGPLTLIPVFHSGRSLEYLLLAEAVAAGLTRAEEMGTGVVENVVVEHGGPSWVLLVEGQVLVGLRQNRVLNTSVLVPPGEKVLVPVSCVEQSRWGYLAEATSSPDVFTPPEVRRITAAGVQRNLRAAGRYGSDQDGVWAEIRHRVAATGTSSPSEDYVEVHRTQHGSIREIMDGIRPNPGQRGVAAVIGGRLAALDLFDGDHALERLWEPLVGGYAADALLRPCPYGARPGRRRVREAIRTLGRSRAQVHRAPGAGETVQLADGRGATASALVHDGVVVHVAAHWPSRA